MKSERILETGQGSDAAPASLALTLLLSAHGAGAHPFLARRPLSETTRVDLAHALCQLHAGFPSLADHAATDPVADPGARAFIRAVADAFAAERAWLARLVAQAPALPATLGQARCDGAVLTLRRTLATLGASTRAGTAFGATIALANDWRPLRAALGGGAAPGPFGAPDAALLAPLDAQPGVARAVAFGARQLLDQHRALLNLLLAREAERGG